MHCLLRSDGTGYHVWTRALLDRDLSFCRWSNAIEGFVSVKDNARNFCQNKYPPGLALLRFPVMVFLVDRSDPNNVAITPEEHEASLIFGGAFLWFQAALLIWTAALLRLPAWRSSAAVMLATFGTGLFHYGTYDGCFTHVYSAFFCTLLILLAVREHVTSRPMPATLLALSAFFLFSLRNTNVFLLAELALAYAIWHRAMPRSELAFRKFLPLAIGAGTAIGLQLAYNYMAAGTFTVSSYGEEGFVWNRPMQWEVLFSYERGLFTYYPMFGLALVCGAAVPQARPATILLGGLVLSLMTLYGFWHSWPLGAGMGHRGFVEMVPVVALVLCLAFASLSRSVYVAVLLVGMLSASVTLQIMYGYWVSTFYGAGGKADTYWAHMHTFESFVVGGTMCRPSRCSISQWHCESKDARDSSFCIEGFRHKGMCVAGECAAFVALRALSNTPEPIYVSAPPPRKNRFCPLTVGAKEIGPWEKFALVPTRHERSQVRLMSLLTRLYVSAPQVGDDPSSLITSTPEASERETFTLRGSSARLALKAWNGQFVSPFVVGPDRVELKAVAKRATSKQRFAIEYVTP